MRPVRRRGRHLRTASPIRSVAIEICCIQKDLIVAGGYNIYPKEIDEVLFDHPKILEACAVGDTDAGKMLADIRRSRPLSAAWGLEAADTPSLIRCLVVMGWIGMERDQIQAIDVNPMIIRGSLLIAVDALVVLTYYDS